MKPRPLYTRDFTLMVLGQIVSLFGNAVLRFALSLYVLDRTGSAAVFGGILALSMVTTVLCAPLGGAAADRFPRQRIMAGLDFLTAALVAGYALLWGGRAGIAPVGVLMVLLSLIQALYQPSVQASLPVLVCEAHLMAANGVVAQVQALAGLLGPILGGLLYGSFGLDPMLAVSAACFFASAGMELFLRIPFTPPDRAGSALTALRGDLAGALRFLTRDKPRLLQMLVLLAGLNLFLSSLFVVGLPYLIKVHLGLSAQLYGFAEGAMGLGAVLGGLLSGLASRWMELSRCHRFLLGTTLLLAPIALVLALDLPPLVSYGVILTGVLLAMGCATLFNLALQTFLQRETPPHLLGKTASFVSAICTCAYPLGQALYGVLFQLLRTRVWAAVGFGLAASLLLSLAAGRILGHLEPSRPAAD